MEEKDKISSLIDRKEFVNELEEGKGAGVWFCIIFVLFMVLIFVIIDRCTYKPTVNQSTADSTHLKPIKDTVTLSEYIHEKNLDSVIKTLPIGTTELVFDEKEDLTRSIDGLFEDKLPLEKPEL